MLKSIAVGVAGFLLMGGSAFAQQCPASFPATLTNGTTANANDVMSDFNAIRNCPALGTNPYFTGNVGIGTSSPWLPFVVQSASGVIGLNGTAGTTTDGQVAFYNSGTLVWKLFAYHANQNFYLQNGGNGTNMTVVGGTNSWSAASDVRLKQNVKTLPVLDRLDGYRAVSFDWKETGKHDIGVIAQELYKVFPEIVNKGSDGVLSGSSDRGMWSVQYDRLGALALEAAKELKAENDTLRAANDKEHDQVSALISAVHKQQDEITSLKTQVAALRQTKILASSGH